MASSVRPDRVLILLGCAALLVSCARSAAQGPSCDAEAAPSSPVGHASDLVGHRESFTKTYCFRVAETMTGIEVRIALSITEGSVEWTLTDPTGASRWADEVSGFKMSQSTDEFPPVVGTWQLEVVGSQVKGGYNVLWTARP